MVTPDSPNHVSLHEYRHHHEYPELHSKDIRCMSSFDIHSEDGMIEFDAERRKKSVLITGSRDDRQVKFWTLSSVLNAASAPDLHCFYETQLPDWISAIASSERTNENSHVASGCGNGAIYIYTAKCEPQEEAQHLMTCTGHAGPISSLSWQEELSRTSLTLGSWDEHVRLWKIMKNQRVQNTLQPESMLLPETHESSARQSLALGIVWI